MTIDQTRAQGKQAPGSPQDQGRAPRVTDIHVLTERHVQVMCAYCAHDRYFSLHQHVTKWDVLRALKEEGWRRFGQSWLCAECVAKGRRLSRKAVPHA